LETLLFVGPLLDERKLIFEIPGFDLALDVSQSFPGREGPPDQMIYVIVRYSIYLSHSVSS